MKQNKHIRYDDKQRLCQTLLHLFRSAGWADGSESDEMIKYFNLPFINSTLVISAWDNEGLLGL